MYTELIINVNPSETRIAILEDKNLVELIVERNENRHIVGDIFKGRVDAVISGMQASFVDLGLERSGFLHVSDMMNMAHYSEILDMEDEEDEEENRKVASNGSKETKPIQEVLSKNQEILVQISKEPIGTKGPRLTTRISLAGRYVVLMPGEHHIGVSRKIKDREERRRLRKVIKEVRPDSGEYGVIVRTASAEKQKSDLRSDINNLVNMWEKIKNKADRAKAPALIHQDATFISGTVRDIFSSKVNSLVIDSKIEYNRILNYVRTFSDSSSGLIEQIKLYQEDTPIFDAYDIEKQVESAMSRKVWLKSGGYIAIDHTEALVAIDVNTGKFVSKKTQEETILQTNLEAAGEIARQLRLRDIGGIIVVDFIDMEQEKHKREVMNTFKKAMENDRSKPKIYKVSELGLVEMTRKRVRPSLIHTFYESCPFCNGTGRVVSRNTTAMKIERWLRRAAAYSDERELETYAHPTVVDYLIQDKEVFVLLKEKYGMNVEIKIDPTLKMEDFKFYSLRTGEDITKQFTI